MRRCMLQAAGLTLRIGAIGILIAVGVGLICCLARYYRVPVLNAVCGGYIDACAEHAAAGPAVLSVFRAAEDRGEDFRRSVCDCGTCVSGRRVYGGIVPQRAGSGQPGAEGSGRVPGADYAGSESEIRDSPAGAGGGDSGGLRKCDFPFEGDERVQRGRKLRI